MTVIYFALNSTESSMFMSPGSHMSCVLCRPSCALCRPFTNLYLHLHQIFIFYFFSIVTIFGLNHFMEKELNWWILLPYYPRSLISKNKSHIFIIIIFLLQDMLRKINAVTAVKENRIWYLFTIFYLR